MILGPVLRFFVLLFLVVSTASIASQVQAANLVELYSQALDNDPKLKGTEFKAEAVGESAEQAFAELLPKVSAEIKYDQTFQDIESSDNTVFAVGSIDFTTTNYTLKLTQPIFRYQSLLGLGQAEQLKLRATVEVDHERQQLIVRLAEAYLQALAAEDNLEYTKSEEETVTEHYTLASKRYELGLAPVTDLYDAKARLAAVQADRLAAEHLLDDALEAIGEIVGSPVEELSGLSEDAPMVAPEPDDPESWVAKSMENNLAIVAAKYDVEAARYEMRKQRAAHLPTLDLVASVNREETEGTLFGGGSVVNNCDIGAVLTLPIYEGGMVNSRTREAGYQLSAAQQALTERERAAKRETRAAFYGVKTAISRQDSLKKAVESQEMVLTSKEKGFNAGLFTSIAVLDASRDLHMARRDFAQARYDYLLNSLKLRLQTGLLSEEQVAQISGWLE